ncbi:hypothetical protein LXL04_015999 [Taraxacum kok-saghyz]
MKISSSLGDLAKNIIFIIFHLKFIPSLIFIKQTLMNSPTFVLTLSKLMQSQVINSVEADNRRLMSLYQKTESRSWNSRSRDGVGAKIEIESLLVKSRLGINGIGMESVIDRIRNAAGNDCDRVWDRLPKSELFTYRDDLVAIGNTVIGNADRGYLSVSVLPIRNVEHVQEYRARWSRGEDVDTGHGGAHRPVCSWRLFVEGFRGRVWLWQRGATKKLIGGASLLLCLSPLLLCLSPLLLCLSLAPPRIPVVAGIPGRGVGFVVLRWKPSTRGLVPDYQRKQTHIPEIDFRGYRWSSMKKNIEINVSEESRNKSLPALEWLSGGVGSQRRCGGREVDSFQVRDRYERKKSGAKLLGRNQSLDHRRRKGAPSVETGRRGLGTGRGISLHELNWDLNPVAASCFLLREHVTRNPSRTSDFRPFLLQFRRDATSPEIRRPVAVPVIFLHEKQQRKAAVEFLPAYAQPSFRRHHMLPPAFLHSDVSSLHHRWSP